MPAPTLGRRARRVRVVPVTPDRWTDLEALFGERGACAGCWCMWWRLPRGEWTRGRGAGNRRALRKLVSGGPPPGVLAYVDGDPAGWCAVAPREAYGALDRSRVLAKVDAAPVWSVTCFFVARPYRRTGLSAELLRGAVKLARSKGARIVEGYPTEARGKRSADVFVFTGLASSFLAAGFHEVARRSPARPIMRRAIR